MPSSDSPTVRKGRGAVSNPTHRFASTRSETVDDGWQPVAWVQARNAGVYGVSELTEQSVRDRPLILQDYELVKEGDLSVLAQATSEADEDAKAEANADWDAWAGGADARTEVIPEVAKSAISRNQSPDVPFDRSLNPYRGCEHGCIYCFARPTHSYLGWSPGLDEWPECVEWVRSRARVGLLKGCTREGLLRQEMGLRPRG